MSNSLLNKDFIFIDYEARDKEDLLKSLSGKLKEKGYVKESYTQGLLDREVVFPTGLRTEGVQVAIPHTDAKHVNIPAIVFAKLKNPVIFKEMGNGENDVEAKMIFMLAIKNPNEQVKTLSKLMSIFSNKQILEKLYNSGSKDEIEEILSNVLNG